MKKSATGTFTGQDFHNFGQHGTLPGSGWLSGPPRPPTHNAPPAPPTPPAPATPQVPAPQNQNGMGGMLGNFRNPQGFGQLAAFARPLTHAVMGYGGLPALMGLYGMFSGSRDFSNSMTQDPLYSGPSRLLTPPPGTNPNMEVQASARFPLPVAEGNKLVMPRYEKRATELTIHPAPGGYGVLPEGIQPFIPMPGHQAPTPLPTPHMPRPTAEPAPPTGNPLAGVAAQQGTAYALDRALAAAAPNVLRNGVGPRLTALTARTLPRAVAPTMSRAISFSGGPWATPFNAAMEAVDVAGVHPLGDSQAPGLLRQNGRWGWNPDAMAHHMADYNHLTTPDGTIAFGLRTGNPLIDHPASYGMSALSAWGNPLRSAYTAGRTQYWDMNPGAQLLFNPEERAGWVQLLRNRPASGSNMSMPLTAANHLAGSQPWRPSQDFQQGGRYFQNEAAIHRRQNHYHPTYNPGGQVGQPGVVGRVWDRLWN